MKSGAVPSSIWTSYPSAPRSASATQRSSSGSISASQWRQRRTSSPSTSTCTCVSTSRAQRAQRLTGKSAAEIATDLRTWFAETDPSTDFNAFFQRVAVHVKRNNLVLSPLSIVLFSDGVPDFPGNRYQADDLYRNVDLAPLEPQ